VTNPNVVLYENTNSLKAFGQVESLSLQDAKRSIALIQKRSSLVALKSNQFDIKDYRGIKVQSDPKALIEGQDFINLVRKVESVYKDDTREEIITRIRRLYYPRRKGNFVKDESNTLKFDRLLPNRVVGL
jgi:hypothetical protein